ncbi:hypothetical protein GU3_10330 [Oceanimonas sp. GK1]|uniref:hypothetical protein n=1 Tax=Oceanimonas sp. (strain GK1 / IBRC-M 10197) TaxID=511062 RepID=UPI000249518A|nr:hypothetical protein [Oceanimonas sp. GK1]AEY01822.1 hypothetical protein GU3_10330 [Oceanimonas sp. GK1]
MTASIFLNDYQVELLCKARDLQERRKASLDSISDGTFPCSTFDAIQVYQHLDEQLDSTLIDFASSVLLYLPADFAE